MNEMEKKMGQFLLETLKRDAYQDGFNAGHSSGVTEGLRLAWEAAQKIGHGALWLNGDKENKWTCARDVFDSLTALDAIKKIKEEEASRGVRAGDVVCDSSGDIIGVVIGREEDGEDYAVMDKEGRVCSYPRCEFAKTDKRFPEIEAVLSGMRGMTND